MVACTPHPGFGTVAIQRPALVQVVDLATCRRHTRRSAARQQLPPGVEVVVTKNSQSIVYHGRTVLTVREDHRRAPAGMPGPIVVQGISPNRRWILFAIDPQGSASLMADGLLTQVLSVDGGKPHPLTTMLNYADYRAWCGDKLVFSAGGDREATIHKQLDVASAPDWKPRPLTGLRGRAWGSVVCARDRRSVIVQSQPSEELRNFFSTRWQLWRVSLHGTATKLTSPPKGYADESPQLSPDGRTVYFVRSTRGHGELYALRGGRVVGPLLTLGYSLGYYGANGWQYTVTR